MPDVCRARSVSESMKYVLVLIALRRPRDQRLGRVDVPIV